RQAVDGLRSARRPVAEAEPDRARRLEVPRTVPRLLSASAVAAAVGHVGLTLTDDVVVLALLSAAAGLGLGLGKPLSMTMAVCLAPESARCCSPPRSSSGDRLSPTRPIEVGVCTG